MIDDEKDNNNYYHDTENGKVALLTCHCQWDTMRPTHYSGWISRSIKAPVSEATVERVSIWEQYRPQKNAIAINIEHDDRIESNLPVFFLDHSSLPCLRA